MGCGLVAPKRLLLRYVANDGALVADPAARRPGRGAYTHQTRECFERARTRGGFNRAFRRAVRVDFEEAPLPISSENVHLDTA
ncbi:MAG: YlxR family protein [Conexibacter sp.]|nr:YlxR family protein [Conexibacter sp.]